jgi:hypothetical protein
MPVTPAIDLLAPLLEEPANLAALQDELAWSTIKEEAGRFGVGPLVAYAARSHVSAVERAWCDRVLSESWLRHDRMLRHLEYLSGLLATASIRTIALKGPLLAERYYSPAFLRKPSLDIDLAIAAKDLARAVTILEGAGYTLDFPLEYARVHSHHVELSHASKPHVELHFRLTHRALGIPVEEFFERAVPRKLPNGESTLVLAPADQLLHLVLHLAQSRFGTLFHLYEIRKVWNAEPAAREEALQRAAAHHYSGAFRMMDVAFRCRWGEPFLPPQAQVPRTWLDGRLTPALYRRFEEWSVPGRGLSVTERVRARWLDFQLTDTPADALCLALFFLRTARFNFTSPRAWGTVKHLRFAPAHSTAQGDFSPTKRDK